MDAKGSQSLNGFIKTTETPLKQEELKFGIYERYIENFSEYIRNTYKDSYELSKSVISVSKEKEVRENLDLSHIKRYLFISWNTEFLCSYNDINPDIEIVRISNQWKPIQSYYVVYTIAKSFLHLIGKQTDHHSACQKRISEYMSTTLKGIVPWSLAFIGYEGNKKTISTLEPVNFPSSIHIPNPLKEMALSPIDSIACCLRAEHRHRIKEGYKDVRPKIFKYRYDPGFTSLFHFLYRLRVKSNYRDAEIFIADSPAEKVQSFAANLTFLVYSTNIVVETLICKKIGKNNLLALIDEFLTKNAEAKDLVRRRDIYNSIF